MRSPIKNRMCVNNAGAAARTLIPPGSIVNSYAFFDGKAEFSFAENNIFVKAHTDSIPIYHFWKVMEADPRRVYDVVTCDDFKFEDEQMFTVLQDIWHENESPLIKSSLFFLLNSYSKTGLVSSGEIHKEHFNPVSLSYLRRFAMPQNFHILHSEDSIEKLIEESADNEYNFINGGRFNYSLFEHGKSRGVEETLLNHRKIMKLLQESKKKIIVTYDFDEKVISAFKGSNLSFIDRQGRITTNKETTEEIIVANF